MGENQIVYEQIPPQEMLIIKSYYQHDETTEPFEFDYRDQRYVTPKQEEEEVYTQRLSVRSGVDVDFPVGWIECVSMAIVVADKSNRADVEVYRDGNPTGFLVPPSRAIVIHHQDCTSLSFRCEHDAKLKVTVFPG